MDKTSNYWGTVAVKINNKTGPYFVSKKGVRQGYPLSPILFNIATDCLTRMVRKAQENNLIIGLDENLIPQGVAILQNADDTIVCLKDEDDVAINMKLLLYLYEAMSRLKINFDKSEVVMINSDEGRVIQIAELFNCQIGNFPIKYLGVLVSPTRLHIKDWSPLERKNKKILAVWMGGMMSIAGRTTLIISSLSNSFIYHMSMYLLPKTVKDRLDKQRRIFLWQEGVPKGNIGWSDRKKYVKARTKGGLGIKDIGKTNISLLCKWWWRLEKEKGLWQDLIKKKYLQNDGVSIVRHMINDSLVWCDLLKIRGL
jgi:hypothetical protein